MTRFPGLSDLPGRIVTGAFILHSGLAKRNAAAEHAKAVHGMAAGAFPFLEEIEPEAFVRMLSKGEIAVGAALLSPFVSNRLAGAALAGFSGSLLAMYWRTPKMHEPGSIWPTQAGTAVSKDVWMFGIGLGLVLSRRRR